MIDLDEKYLLNIRNILFKFVPELEVRAFGSRVNGTAKQYSDLDLVLIGRKKIYPEKMMAVKDAFSDSDLPIKVDVIDWHDTAPEFQNIIRKEWVLIQPSVKQAGG